MSHRAGRRTRAGGARPDWELFAACKRARGEGAGDAASFAVGLRAVIGGELDEFSLEYPCRSPTLRRWFIARATRFEFDGEVRAVVKHANITTRKLAEEATRFRSHLLDTVEQAVITTGAGVFVRIPLKAGGGEQGTGRE